MADATTADILVAASRERLLEIVSDFSAYPEWIPTVKRTEVLSTLPSGYADEVLLVLDAGILKDEYVLKYDWKGLEGVSWTLIKSSFQKAQVGSYTFLEAGAQTKIVYALSVTTMIPMIGMLKRKIERQILDTALKDLKKRAEA